MSEFTQWFSTFLSNRLVQGALVLLIAFGLNLLINRLVLQRIYEKTLKKREDLRYDTLFSVLKKVTTGIIWFFAALQLMQVLFRVNPASVIAATGVVGVALGLGTQSLIKDSINGFLILCENQYSMGELVTIEGFTGTVEEINLRITKIRNINGDLFIIPNSAVVKVVNHSRFERGVLTGVSVDYGEDISRVTAVLQAAGEQAAGELGEITEIPQVLGVTELGESGVFIKMLTKCENGAQFMVEREMLRRIKEAFDREGISIPYNHVVVIGR